jgi:hypothetical protein
VKNKTNVRKLFSMNKKFTRAVRVTLTLSKSELTLPSKWSDGLCSGRHGKPSYNKTAE